MRFHEGLLGLGFFLSVISGAHAAPYQYRIENIDLPVDLESRAMAIGMDGAVSGFSVTASGAHSAYISDASGSYFLPRLPGQKAYPFGMSGANAVVGYLESEQTGNTYFKPFKFTPQHGLQILPIPNGFSQGAAMAINAKGLAVGAVLDKVSLIPYVSSWGGTTVRRYPWQGLAMAVNDKGDFAGFTPPASGQPEQAFIVEGGRFLNLGTMPAPFDGDTRVLGMNNCNDLVGYGSGSSGPGSAGSFGMIRYSGGPLSLTSEEHISANDINNRRQFVGTFIRQGGGGAGVFLRDPDGSEYDLLELAVNPSDWYGLIFASGINDRGEVSGVGFVIRRIIPGPTPSYVLGMRAFRAVPLYTTTLPPFACAS